MRFLRKYYLFTTFLALSFTSCYDNVQSSIPDFPVYLELNLISTYPTFLNSTLHCLTFETLSGLPITDRIGYGGILVCTGFEGEYTAYDMACPYEAKRNIRVHPNGIGQAVCDSCGSVFDIGYGFGSPISGKAKQPLKRYKTTLSSNILYVTPL
ncbi:MAG: hypothetical protein P4L34_12985 [Paludibacter sp.]|nr:hypothetical protein [Paludibacter sp.]